MCIDSWPQREPWRRLRKRREGFLLRGSYVGELTRQELAEIIEDAWLSRASARRAEA